MKHIINSLYIMALFALLCGVVVYKSNNSVSYEYRCCDEKGDYYYIQE